MAGHVHEVLKEEYETSDEGASGVSLGWEGPEDAGEVASLFAFIDKDDFSDFTVNIEPSHKITPEDNSRIAISKPLLALLKECLVNHRWKEANLVLESLCLDPKTTNDIIWRCGAEVMYCHPKSSVGVMELFYGKMKKLSSHHQVQKTVEHSMYLLSKGQLEEAHRTITQHQTSGLNIGEDEHQSEGRWKLMTTLYTGLMEYVMWAENVDRRKEEDERDNETDKNADLDNLESGLANSYARRAIQHFEVSTEIPGTWDIFITKHVELLEHYGRYDEANILLEKYKAMNPENLNAHKYLYYFLKKRDAHPNELIPVLKELLSLVPSDALALEMCEILQNTDVDQALSLPFLFNLLDYGCWQNDLRPWVMLADQLTAVYENPTDEGFKVLRECWTGRLDWWPSYHFREGKVKVTSDTGQQLLERKAIVASFLLNQENTYVKHVLENLHDDGQLQAKLKRIKKLKKKTRKIHRNKTSSRS